MPDYKKMYTLLFQSQTKAINILQEAQKETESMYVDADPPDIRLFERPEDKAILESSSNAKT